jgi:uncharacterized protein
MIINSGIDIYDGEMLSSRFAYKFFKDKVIRTGNIIAFRAPMRVEKEHMVDIQDLMDEDYIYSDDAINFLIEIPDIDLFGGVCFQRIFNSLIANILAEKYLKCDIEIDGDDIMVHKEHERGGIVQSKGKASVSIAKKCNGAVLIHTGINIRVGKSKAPAFAFSTNLTDEQAQEFMQSVVKMFYGLSHDLFVATSKVI